MARKKMDRDMAKAVAYDRLSAKAYHAGNSAMSTRYWEKSMKLKEQVYRRRAVEAAQAKEKKLFERDLKKLGMAAALEAAKERREKSDG